MSELLYPEPLTGRAKQNYMNSYEKELITIRRLILLGYILMAGGFFWVYMILWELLQQ